MQVYDMHYLEALRLTGEWLRKRMCTGYIPKSSTSESDAHTGTAFDQPDLPIKQLNNYIE